MKASNGMGTIVKLSGKRRKPYALKGQGVYTEKGYYQPLIETFATKKEAEAFRIAYFNNKILEEKEIEISKSQKTLLFEDLYKIQRDNDGILPITEAEEEAKSEGGIQDARWKDNWSSEYLTKWIASKPSLVDVNLQDYFWVARDALKNEKPIASFVTSKVSLIFKNLCSIQLDRAMKRQLPAILNSLDEEELNMLLHLLNDRLRKNPDSQICWRILNCDENNILISNNLECIKQLFAGVDTYHIDPQASVTFSRLLNIKGEIHDYVEGIKKSTALINTLKRKNK